MTREQRKQRRRSNVLMAICWIIALVCIALSCVIYCNASYDGEAVKTSLSVVGAFTVSGALMRVVTWLDKGGHKNGV